MTLESAYNAAGPKIVGYLVATGTDEATARDRLLAAVYLVGAGVVAAARMRQYGTHGTSKTDGTPPPSRSSR